MSQLIIRTSYENPQPYGDRTQQVFGTQYETTNWVFDTDSRTVTAQAVGSYDDFQDSNHPEEFNYEGEFYSYCAGTTRRGFTGDTRGGFTVAEELDSVSCGYALSCDLGTASVTQQLTAGGATLTLLFDGKANGTAWYSLDGGVEQTSPTFRKVAPGRHQLKVRDADLADCARTVAILVDAPSAPTVATAPVPPTGPAQGVDFVGQPLWYPLGGLAAGTVVELELFAESRHGAEDFALVLRLRQQADAAGRVSFRLDTLLWPLLSAFVPTVAATTQVCRDNLANYFVRTTTHVASLVPTVALGPLRTALRGGLPAERQGRDYFAERLTGYAFPPFLSWQPLGPGPEAAEAAKLVTADQPEWLFWLCPLAQDQALLRVARAYDQGAAAIVTDYEYVGRPARGWGHQLLAIPLLPARAGYGGMRVQVQTTDGQPLSPAARYQFVAASPRTRHVLFTNSLGGLDTLRCEGRLDVTLEAAVSLAERPARFGDAAATAESQVSELVASRKLRLATGWLLPAELAWLQELVLAREVWQQLGGQLRPLEWSKRSLAAYGDEPALRGLLLDCDYAYAPTAYAPGTY